MEVAVLMALAFGVLWFIASAGTKADDASRARARDAANEVKLKQLSGTSTARRPGPSTYKITYTDGNSTRDSRQIALYKSGHTNTHFEAWCDKRSNRRTFAFSGLDLAEDLSTGETFTKAEFFKKVHPARKVPQALRY